MLDTKGLVVESASGVSPASLLVSNYAGKAYWLACKTIWNVQIAIICDYFLVQSEGLATMVFIISIGLGRTGAIYAW